MNVDQLLFWYMFVAISFSLVNMTELAPGVYLNSGEGFSSILSGIQVDISQMTYEGNKTAAALEGSLLSGSDVKVMDMGGTPICPFSLVGVAYCFDMNWPDIYLPPLLGKPMNLVGSVIVYIFLLVIIFLKFILNTIIGPSLLIKNLLYQFFPTSDAYKIADLILIPIQLYLIWKIGLLLASIISGVVQKGKEAA